MPKRTAFCDYNTEDRSFLFLLMSPGGFIGYYFSSNSIKNFLIMREALSLDLKTRKDLKPVRFHVT